MDNNLMHFFVLLIATQIYATPEEWVVEKGFCTKKT